MSQQWLQQSCSPSDDHVRDEKKSFSGLQRQVSEPGTYLDDENKSLSGLQRQVSETGGPLDFAPGQEKAAPQSPGQPRSIHGVDWQKIMDDKLNALDAGVAGTEKRMTRAKATFKAFDKDRSGSLDTQELMRNKATICETIKIRYIPSNDEMMMVRPSLVLHACMPRQFCVCSS